MDPVFIIKTIYAQNEIFFMADDGGMLRVIPPPCEEDGGHDLRYIKFSFILGFEHRPGELAGWSEDWDACHCRIRVVDAEGSLREAKSLFNTNVLLENIEDWRRNNWVHRFDRAESKWKQAFETRVLLTGIRGYYDDRFYRRIILDDQIYEIPFKYQGPIFDIAFLEDPERDKWPWDLSRLLVRVSEFRTREGDEIPPFVYEMDCETLMFHADTQGLPVPLIFKKIGSVEQPQVVSQLN